MIFLSQRDQRWSQIKLLPSNLTIGRYGCTTCCISMLSDYFGCFESPDRIIGKEVKYTKDGLVIWSSINFPKFTFRERFYGQDNQKILEALKNPKKAVILNVNDGQHWVVGLSKTLIGNDYLAADPWNGKKISVLKTYRNITGGAIFQAL